MMRIDMFGARFGAALTDKNKPLPIDKHDADIPTIGQILVTHPDYLCCNSTALAGTRRTPCAVKPSLHFFRRSIARGVITATPKAEPFCLASAVNRSRASSMPVEDISLWIRMLIRA